MCKFKGLSALLSYLAVYVLVLPGAFAQEEKSKKPLPAGKAVMWEPVNISERDLFSGPGGDAMRPDLRTVTFINEETQGHNKKYRIRDASARVWVANYEPEVTKTLVQTVKNKIKELNDAVK
jgi:hypothetical protein